MTKQEIENKPNTGLNFAGMVFGELKVIEYLGRDKRRDSVWRCICSCGETRNINSSSLKFGRSLSCGHLRLEKTIIHGQYGTTEYLSWQAMKARILNPKSPNYKYYGGRGLTLCDRWLEFKNFFADMGTKPTPKHSIERIDSNKGYYKENCKWATSIEQGNNRRNNIKYIINSQSKTLTEWCRKKNIRYSKVWTRINKLGWTLDEALTNE